MNNLQIRGKRILVMVLVFAILCTSLPCTPSISVHAAQTDESYLTTPTEQNKNTEPAPQTEEPTAMVAEEPAKTEEVTVTTAAEPAGTEKPATTMAAEPAGTEKPTATIAEEPAATDEATAVPTAAPAMTEEPAVTEQPVPTPSPVPDHPDLYITSGINLQEDTTCGSLYLLEGGFVNLNGHTLNIQNNFWLHSDRKAILGSGKICLGGNLIQTPAAATDSLYLEYNVTFSLCGNQTQEIQLAYPENSYLGQLDLRECVEAYLPETICCYSLTGIRNLHAGEKLCLKISQFNLDSDISLPGDLTLLDGNYQIGRYQLEAGGDLNIQEKSSNVVQINGGSLNIHGETCISGGLLSARDQGAVISDGTISLSGGRLQILNGKVETGKDLVSEEGGMLILTSGNLVIHGNWEIRESSGRQGNENGEIALYGDLIQQEGVGPDKFNLVSGVHLRLKGDA